MRVARTRSSLLSLAAALLIGLMLTAGAARAITGGELDNDRHPAAGALFLLFEPGVFALPDPGVPPDILPICSGSLIAANDDRGLFLTAGHCVLELGFALQALAPLGPTAVVSFSGDLHADLGVTIPVDLSALHFQLGIPGPPIAIGALPGFDDIGLLVLEAESAADLPAPLALPEPGFLDSLHPSELRHSEYRTIGFGDDVTEGTPHTRVFTFGTRKIGFPRIVNMDDKYLLGQQIEAAGNSGDYFGDSGGPTFWVDPMTGEEMLVAINGAPLGAVGVAPFVAHHAQYYRIDTAPALAFIEEVLEAEEF
jgi:hypothetical protein